MRFICGLILCGSSLLGAHAQSLLGGGGGGSGGGSPLWGVIGMAFRSGNVLNTDAVERTRDFEPRAILGLGVSLQWASILRSSGHANASCLPWVGASVEAGPAVTYRDRVGFALVGAWGLNGYYLSLDSVDQPLYHTSKRAEFRTWWMTRPRGRAERVLKFGLAAGFTFQSADELVKEESGYRSVTFAQRRDRPYLAPELGRIGAVGKDRFELSLRYVVHLDGQNAWESNARLGNRSATFSARDNHLALMVRYHIGIKRKPAPPIPAPAVAFEDRATDTLATLNSRPRRITLRLWDDAEVDGDTISVLLNEVPVLSGHALTREPLRMAVDLRRGWNTLLVVAHNEGTVPPNTARCLVRCGKGREDLLIKTSRKKNQLVRIRCE